MPIKSPSKAFADVGRALADGLRGSPARSSIQPSTPIDWFAAERARNDVDPRRHARTFRHYETDRRDFRYLVEDIWDGYPVDEGATDSVVAVLRVVLAAAEQGYASRVTSRDGSSVQIAQPGQGGFLDEEWGPSRVESAALISGESQVAF